MTYVKGVDAIVTRRQKFEVFTEYRCFCPCGGRGLNHRKWGSKKYLVLRDCCVQCPDCGKWFLPSGKPISEEKLQEFDKKG